MSDKKIPIVSASPKIRKFARELGADLHLIKGSEREGRVSEDDVKLFIKKSLSGNVKEKVSYCGDVQRITIIQMKNFHQEYLGLILNPKVFQHHYHLILKLFEY